MKNYLEKETRLAREVCFVVTIFCLFFPDNFFPNAAWHKMKQTFVCSCANCNPSTFHVLGSSETFQKGEAVNSAASTSFQGEGNGTPLQYSRLENPMDGGAWQAAVCGVSKSRTWLSNFSFTFHFHALEKEMATHSSVLAWRIPGTGEPGGLPSMGSHRVEHDWSNLAEAPSFQRYFQGLVLPKTSFGKLWH